MTGAGSGLTVKVVVHVALLLHKSVTVIVITLMPGPTELPAGGDWVMMSEAPGEQLSVAVTKGTKSGTVAWHKAFAVALCCMAQVMITGGVLSITVITCLPVLTLVQASVAVQVRVIL